LCTAGAVAALAPEFTRLRVAWRRARRAPDVAPVAFVGLQLLCGAAVALLLVGFERLLAATVDPLSVDLRHFSLHPWSPPRLALLAGVVLWEVSALWTGVLIAAVGLARWRLPRAWSKWHAIAAVCWFAPIAAVTIIASSRESDIPAAAVLLGGAATVAAALVAPRITTWYRRTTVASRILALFVAFLVPALLVYPSANFLSERATRRLIESRYAVEAMDYARTLQEQLNEALGEIDRLAILPALVTGTSNDALTGLRTDSAFLVWSQTALARTRLTSGIELYDRNGALISPFALNFPEYTGARQRLESVAGCRWDVFGEALPFGSEDRRTLHAQRNICVDGQTVGTIVVHVVFDFRALPFITSQNPYFAVFRAGGSPEGTVAADIETAIYGWALGPIYASGRSAWAISEDLFARIYHARDSFWTALEKQGATWRVYVSNNREGIYAIGYPVPSLFDGFVRIAELTTFAGALYVVLLFGTAAFTRIARARPLVGRALLREIRASFYRKLFLAFVLASIIPVLTLAFVVRAYFANLLLAGVQAEAARTAAVAQRVIEESAAMLRRGSEQTAPFGDDVLVWISQVIDQDVNVFEGSQLSATSERDLFSSGLLPKRTPEDVYRAIVLDRLPSYVTEDAIGTFSYMLAATPVRVEGRPGVLTVPLATRQQEIEREIDDLDRGIHLAALFFILLGAAIGLSMAERIADPVSRLTRATRHIARGDFDERIAVRSSDELRRLVDAFNSMAAELKAQRAQLERTHRLEAWAEMARQVAHEIKNPLTPIQLSAEHLRRVHADRGEPLGPVLEGCVDAILAQVKLLRQIAAEFSSFASAPTARPSRVDPVELVRSVVEPYRAGLQGQIEVENRVTPPLPAIFVDRTLAARALANIVENALHAMPGSGRLVLRAEAGDGFVTIWIEDTGVGMDQEALDRLFEPYFSTKTTGTGLGLPIARRNVELNGGSIDVTSEKGRGTTVAIKLPVAA
jgi:signal transduction histidine kinase